MSTNLKVFLTAFLASIPVWWGMNALSSNLTELFLAHELRANPGIITASAAQHAFEEKLQREYPLRQKGAEQLTLPAQSALSLYVKENGTQKVLFEKNSKLPMPIASISKLMGALVAMEQYAPNERIVITAEILETPGEAGQLQLRDVFEVKDLLHVALMESSNDAAVALTQPLGKEQFLSLMNEKAATLGLQQTSFANATGLDEPEEANLSTAEDLASLTRYLFSEWPQIFDILGQSELALFTPEGTFHHVMRNTNELLNYYAWPASTFGGKTGTTPYAKETLLFVVESPGRPGYIINIILGSEARFQEMRQLLNWILQSYQWSR